MLNGNCGYVMHSLHMPCGNLAVSVEFCDSSGTHIFYHLPSNEADFTGGQVTVVAVGQVDTNTSCAACILKRSIASRAWGTLIWLLFFIPNALLLLSSDENISRREHFLFRNPNLAIVEFCMNVNWRKEWWEMSMKKGYERQRGFNIVNPSHQKRWLVSFSLWFESTIAERGAYFKIILL